MKMMMKSSLIDEETVVSSFSFPSAGSSFREANVTASEFSLDSGQWFVLYSGKVPKDLYKLHLKPLIGRTLHFTPNGDDLYEVTVPQKHKKQIIKSNPAGDYNTLIVGTVDMAKVRKNPTTTTEFDDEMNLMIKEAKPGDFTLHEMTKYNNKKFRDKLWGFVTFVGESYGWVESNGDLHHKNGSWILPKLSISKKIKGAKAFYHTHPSKDEPSTTSADDYQWYFDCAFAPDSTREFFTVMKDRIDYFVITPVKSEKDNYLKLNEEKFVNDINGILDAVELEIDKDKEGMDDIAFAAEATRRAVEDINDRFGKYVSVKYTHYIRPDAVRNNPGGGESSFLTNPPLPRKHRQDIMHESLDELKSTTYNQEHYGANEYGHSLWVHWWIDYYFSVDMPEGDKMWLLEKYGLGSSLRTDVRDYLRQEIAPSYTMLDVALLSALYHDVGKYRESQTSEPHWKIAAEMFRDEIGPDLNLPLDIIDAVSMMYETDMGRKGTEETAFRNLSGKYYGVALLVRIADIAAHHENRFISDARTAKSSGITDTSNPALYKEMIIENLVEDLRYFLKNTPRSNPPPKPTYIDYSGSYEVPIDFVLAQENLKEYQFRLINAGQATVKYPTQGKPMTVYLYPSGRFTFRVLMKFGHMVEGDELGSELVEEAWLAIGNAIAEFQPNMKPIMEKEPEPEVRVNPRHAINVKVISISGPRGAGKSTFARVIAQQIGANFVPTYKTRPKRPREVQGVDSVFISKKKFKEMVENDEFVEWRMQKNGHYYGRRWEDFTESFNIVDLNLSAVRRYNKVFSNLFTLFIKPDPSLSKEDRIKKLLRRGGMSREEAEDSVSIADSQVKQAEKMGFDLTVVSKTGNYEKQAKDVAKQIEQHFAKPIKNPHHITKQGTLGGDSFRDDVTDTQERWAEYSRLLSQGWKNVLKPEGADIAAIVSRYDNDNHRFVKPPQEADKNRTLWAMRPESHVAMVGEIDQVRVDPQSLHQFSTPDNGTPVGGTEDADPRHNPRGTYTAQAFVTISRSTNEKKKLMAVFQFPDGRKKTTHFGGKGYSDYTIHKDKARKKRYDTRHAGREDWEDFTTAGALSKWILWNKPDLVDSFNHYKAMFSLDGIITVKTSQAGKIPASRTNPPTEIPEIIYHVTSEENLNSILQEGLKPKIGALTKYAFQTKTHYDEKIGGPVVWGTTQNKAGVYASMVQPFTLWKNNAILAINTEGLDFQYYSYEEYFTRNEVPPSHIQFLYYMDGEHADNPMWDDTREMWAEKIAKSNPRTPGGKKFPKRYLTGLTPLEKMIAEDEIDKGYKYDKDDPKAYEFWKSDIKATARGLKIGPSKHKTEYYRRYRKNINANYLPAGKTPKQKFLNRVRKETGIKKSILEKVYDKGLAAWRVGHRPGVQQHQWAAGRVYAFVVGADSSTGPGKPDNKLAIEAGVR